MKRVSVVTLARRRYLRLKQQKRPNAGRLLFAVDIVAAPQKLGG